MSKKTTSDYINELKEMVERANEGKPFEPWLMPQLRATAMNMVIIDKLQTAIEREDSLTNSMTGSMGQQKIEVNPLLDKYYKAQSVLIDQFEALGLSHKGKKKAGDPSGEDSIGDYLESIKG